MFKYNLTFSKQDKAIYLSHLDTMRTFQRAFKRAGLPVYHTQGFNPHPYISISVPLSLGFSSLCETLDFALDVPLTIDMAGMLNQALPDGIRVLCVNLGATKPGDIEFSKYLISLQGEKLPDGDAVTKLLLNPETQVLKRSKKGEEMVSICQFLQPPKIICTDQNQLDMEILLKAGSVSMNPSYIITAIKASGVQVEDWQVCRMGLVYKNKEAGA